MKLGFHYHIPAREENGKIFVPGYLGVFLDSLAPLVDQLTCFLHTPLQREIEELDYPLQSSNIRLVSMRPHYSMPKRLLFKDAILSDVKEEVYKQDIILCRAPSPLAPFFVRKYNRHVPFSFLLVGNYVTSADDPSLPFWKNKLIRLFSHYIHNWQNWAVKRMHVFVNSMLLYEENKDIAKGITQVKTTTLSQSDFFTREDTCQGEEIRFLYTGRINLNKGLKLIVDGIKFLSDKNYKVAFDIVGWEEQGAPPVSDNLQKYADEIGVGDQLKFHGKKQIGEELNAMYRQADIFVNASTGNEGFPRTLWEAMANSVPVISSAVGSIPLFLSNNESAVLIPANDQTELNAAMKKVIDEGELRRKIIANGYIISKENTLEVQARRIVDGLNEQVKSSKSK